MIDLYTWATPNGRKISIALEELELAYTVKSVDIQHGAQFEADFLKVSPNSKIPAIVDHETGVSMMESGAILLYLADKTGRLAPEKGPARWDLLQWLFWQAAGQGPMLGQAHHFLKYNKGKSAYAEERFRTEATRLYGVLDRRLAGREFMLDTYSVADIAIWPWVSRFEWHEIDLRAFDNVRRWYDRLGARPAVQRGYKVPDATAVIPVCA